MSEVEWSAEGEEAPRKKKRVPAWVWWGCGGGCLLATLVAIIASIAIGKFVKDSLDPETVWARVHEALPHDQRPEGWNATGMKIPLAGMGQYILDPPRTDAAMILFTFRGQKEFEDMFDPASPANKGLFGLGEIQTPETGTIEIQGRTVRCLRFQAWLPESAREEGVAGASIRVDLTGNGDQHVMVQVTAEGDQERIPDELVQELLAPFDVWRGR